MARASFKDLMAAEKEQEEKRQQLLSPLPEPVENIESNASIQVLPEAELTSKLSTSEQANFPPQQQASFPLLELASHRKEDRHSKSKITVTFRISPQTDELIAKGAKDCRVSKQAFLELAIQHFSDWLANKQKDEVESLLAHDDRRIDFWKTNEIIISLYETYTKNQWKPGDDREARRYNGRDARNVELGILNTLLRTKARKINSFAYFMPEIEEMFAVPLGDDTVNIMLRRRREQWKELQKGK